jgi:hypothetical protein
MCGTKVHDSHSKASHFAIFAVLTELTCDTNLGWLLDWLFTVLRPAQEFFTYMETSPLPVKGCKFRPMLGAQGL